MDKKQLAEAKRNFALHVGLIQHQERVSKSDATFRAFFLSLFRHTGFP